MASPTQFKNLLLPLKLFGPRILGWLTKYYLPVGQRVIIKLTFHLKKSKYIS